RRSRSDCCATCWRPPRRQRLVFLCLKLAVQILFVWETGGFVAIAYQLEPDLTATDFIDILVRSTLAERRPVDRLHVIRAMLEHADIIVTARIDERLVGVSRAISDFA